MDPEEDYDRFSFGAELKVDAKRYGRARYRGCKPGNWKPGDWFQEVCEHGEPLVGMERMVFGVVVVDVMMGWEEIKGRKVAGDGAE